MHPRQRSNLFRSLIILGPLVGYMVIAVAQSDLEAGELINAGLVIATVIIGFVMFVGGPGIITSGAEETTPPTQPAIPFLNQDSACIVERDKLRVENAQLKGQVQAMNTVFQYLDIKVSVRN